jgi:carboxypeptidase Taq
VRVVEEAARAIGFDFERGRLDVTTHPFCSGLGPLDVRMTTRYDENHFNDAFFSVLHEAGHGIYEQGLSMERYGTPVGASCSLGIHESQSRLWENLVGRSRGFWRGFFGTVRAAFPEALEGSAPEGFYRAVNETRPSLIRVEADEVTYNLHIFLRFELELALVSGELEPEDLPGAWNETFERFLGMRPPDDVSGCLQDIHWSAGLIGYFPTYALGNLYASQFFRAAEAELGDLQEAFARGEFDPLRRWLNENIHQHGKRYPPRRLVEVVTGSPLSHEPLMRHLETKYGEIYGL